MKKFQTFLTEARVKKLGGVLPIATPRELERYYDALSRYYDAQDKTDRSKRYSDPIDPRMVILSKKEPKDKKVSLSKVRATQDYITPERIKHYLQGRRDSTYEPAIYHKVGKTYFVWDGHHKTVARLKKGQKRGRARVLDLDETKRDK